MSNLLLFKCITPMHVGSEGKIDVIDAPIQREMHTFFPKVEASGMKGVFRREFERFQGEKNINNNRSMDKINEPDYTKLLFGPEGDGSEHSGSVKLFDGRILLFPVRTAKNIFAWITCPYVLRRFANDLRAMEADIFNTQNLFDDYTDVKDEECLCDLIELNANENYIILDEFAYTCRKLDTYCRTIINNIKSCLTNDKLVSKTDIVVVSDSTFKYFTEMATEINTRIKIGNNGVVDNKHLFTEEYLPSETVMYSFISIDDEESIKQKFRDDKTKNYNITGEFTEFLKKMKVMQLGGNKTLGKGIIELFLCDNRRKK